MAGAAAAVLVVALTVAAPPGSAAAAAPAHAVRPPAVVLDTDMDFDDTAALAYLVQADRLGWIDLRAVTVETTGIAYPGNGLSHARCLLDKLGSASVPVSDGTGTSTNNFPDFARTLLDGIVESGVRTASDAPCPAVPSEGHAAALLDSTIRDTPGDVTLITLGTLTNVADALTDDPGLSSRIGQVFVEGGQLDWSQFGTSFFDAHDYNLWADPESAQTVLRAMPGRVFMSGGQASAFVPLTEAFRQQLAAQAGTPALDSVLTMINSPLLVGAEAENGGGAFWWDPLAAVAATVNHVETFAPYRVTVVQDGDNAGRIAEDPQQGTLVHYGTYADADLFHQVFLDTLAAT